METLPATRPARASGEFGRTLVQTGVRVGRAASADRVRSWSRACHPPGKRRLLLRHSWTWDCPPVVTYVTRSAGILHRRARMSGVFSQSTIQHATQRALADGALRPIKSKQRPRQRWRPVRGCVRCRASRARTRRARPRAVTDPLGDYEPSLFMGELGPSHYVLLNKFQVLAGHMLLVTRRFVPQDACLPSKISRRSALAWTNSMGWAPTTAARSRSEPGAQAPAARAVTARAESRDEVPMERAPRQRRAVAVHTRVCTRRAGSDRGQLHALYRELLDRCGITAVAEAEGEVQSAPYNLLVRRGWMLVVPRSRACFESISVNALGFSGSLFVRSEEELERVRAVGPMQVLRAVAMPQP